MQNIKLAIADDHKQYREVLVKLLSHEKNMQVIFEAENGTDLLQKLESKPVDVILLDYQMPVMNGFEALKKIRIKFPHIKTIINTSNDTTLLEQEFKNAGADAFLLKDADFEILTSIIYEIFEKVY